MQILQSLSQRQANTMQTCPRREAKNPTYFCLMISVKKSSLSTVSTVRPLRSQKRKDLQGQSDVPIPIIVILLKHIRHPLQADAALNEQVKANRTLAVLVESPKQDLDELRAEPVPKRNQSIGVLAQTDVPAPVGVEAIEEGAPRRQEAPEPAELLETDGAGPVAVEHADHHLDGIRVERGPVAVHERGAQLLLCEMAGTCGELSLACCWSRQRGPGGVKTYHLCRRP